MGSTTGNGIPSNTEGCDDVLDYVRGIVDTVREPLLVLDRDLRVQSANPSFYHTFRVAPLETEGRLLYELGDGQWDIPRLHTLLEEILPNGTSFDDFEVEHDFLGIGRKVMLLNARRLRQEGGGERILLALEDVTEQRRAEAERQAIETRFTTLVKNVKDHSIFTLDPEGRVTSWNVAAEHILGYSEAEVLGRHFSFIFTPEDCQQGMPEAELRGAREQGRAEDERWHLRKGGERFWALGIVSALHDAEGRLTGFSKILRDMTAWKQAQEALHASEANYRALFDQAGDGIWLADQEGRFIDVNPAGCKMLGYSRDEHLRLTVRDIIRAADAPRLRELMQTLAAGQHITDVWEIRRADGTFIPLELSHSITPAGFWQAIGRDITERVKAEEALRESESRFRAMADGLPLIVWVHDTEGRQEFVNRTFCEFFGMSAEEAADDGWQALMHPEDAGAYVREFQDSVRVQRPFHAEVRVRAADGQWHWLESWGRPRFGASGVFLGFVGTSADVTERRRAEAARRPSEARYRELVQNANSAILRWTRNGTITYFNEYAERLFGYSASEVAGRHIGILLPDQDSTGWDLSGLVADITSHPERYESNINENLCRDGQRLWMIWTNRPVFDAQGRFVEMLSVGTDVTRLKFAEEALQEANRRKDAFLAILAHELRNPLAPIRTGLDLIQELRGDPAACEEPLRIMDRQISHLVRLVDDLLDVSRISRGKIELRKERLDLTEIIDAALEMSDGGLIRGNRQVTASVPSDAIAVEGDRVRLVQVIGNLLNNAAKFTDVGGCIDIRVTPRGERVEIQVQDDGRGIPRERLDEIFEMFSQVGSGRESGLGIGLCLVRGLVDLHGGTVVADSAGPGCGATFTVSLPLCGSKLKQATTDTAMEPGFLPTPCRVLVVDDNRDITKSLDLVLTMLGAEVQVAHDGAEAVRLFDHWLPTHVLMDLGMPGMDGYEAARRLRAKPSDHAFRLIAMTGWGQEEDRQRVREAGFDEHLIKPVRVAELKAVLSR